MMPADNYDWTAIDRTTAAVCLRSDQIVDDVAIARPVAVNLHQIWALFEENACASLLGRCIASTIYLGKQNQSSENQTRTHVNEYCFFLFFGENCALLIAMIIGDFPRAEVNEMVYDGA